MGDWVRAKACSTNSCVEAREHATGLVQLHSSTLPAFSVFLAADEWAAFRDGIKAGDFDDLGALL